MANYKYTKLAEWIRHSIERGVFRADQRIPTEQELAQRFDLSRHTVRQAVAILEEQGYIYRIQGSGTFVSSQFPRQPFKSTNSKTIGVVISSNTNDYIFSQILRGINDYLTEHDYSVSVRITSNKIQQEVLALEFMAASDIAGLILEPAASGLPSVNSSLYAELAKTIPCVLMHSEFPQLNLPFVSLSDKRGMELLVDHLLACGHRDIAAIMKFDEQTGTNRYLGYLSSLLRHGIPISEDRIYWYSLQTLADLFSEQTAPAIKRAIGNCTAVVCHDDRIAIALIDFLRTQGLGVPQDVSVAGYDDSVIAHTGVPLTTVVHPKEEYGRRIAKSILDLIHNPDQDVSHHFEPRLVIRDSVRNIKA